MSENFNDNLRKARQELNLSQKVVANMIGVAESTYSLYESGNRTPNIAKVKRLAVVLDVSSDRLLGISKE